MAVETQEISAPEAPVDNDSNKGAEKHPFVGDYVPDENGRVTLTVSFPVAALELNENFRPVEGMLSLAELAGLKGYGPDNRPQATLGVERAKITDKTTGGKIDNPNAGRPTGAINLVLHTDETLENAKKRGRAPLSDAAKRASAMASTLIKGALAKPGNEGLLDQIAEDAKNGKISAADALAKIAELMR